MTERAYIRPISVTPDNKTGGCTLCGEIHPVADGPACDIRRTSVVNVGLPIDRTKLLEANELAHTFNTPTVISENGTTVGFMVEGGDSYSLLEQSPAVDIFIETIDPHVLSADTNDQKPALPLDAIKVAQFKMEQGIPINVRPYNPKTRESVERSTKHKLM